VTLPTLFYEVPFAQALPQILSGVLAEIAILSLPVLAAAFVCAFLADFIQVGALFSIKAATPDLKKINPVDGLKKIFSLNNLVELLKSIAKILFLFIVIRMVLLSVVEPLLRIPFSGTDGLLQVLSAVLKKLVIWCGSAFIVIAALDWFWQKHSFIKKQMMSKEEVKQEYKEQEGDPIIKSKRKQLHREMAMNDIVQRARKATVIITNPTRLAVALYYDKEKTGLPIVVAKGENLLAKKIIEVAQEENIPIMQNVPLARDLYDNCPMGQFLPSEFFAPVAEVLRWVQQLGRE